MNVVKKTTKPQTSEGIQLETFVDRVERHPLTGERMLLRRTVVTMSPKARARFREEKPETSPGSKDHLPPAS